MVFIPFLNAKSDFFAKKLDMSRNNAHELKKLELAFDTFPLNKDADERNFARWVKYENDNRNYYIFNSKPDYMNEDLFFNVMNGRIPDGTGKKITGN